MAEAYDVKQVAEKLKISTSSVKRLIKDGKLKAFKINGHGYIINEISLKMFFGNKVEDCINKEEFEKDYIDWNKMYNGKVIKEKFFEYYCSLFSPGPELPQDHFLIKDEPVPKPVLESKIEDKKPIVSEKEKSAEIQFTKKDIITIIESLNKVQQILYDKIK